LQISLLTQLCSHQFDPFHDFAFQVCTTQTNIANTIVQSPLSAFTMDNYTFRKLLLF